jgi:hypothetical protein
LIAAEPKKISMKNITVIPAQAGTPRTPVVKVRTSAGASFSAIAGAGFPLARE